MLVFEKIVPTSLAVDKKCRVRVRVRCQLEEAAAPCLLMVKARMVQVKVVKAVHVDRLTEKTFEVNVRMHG